MNTTVTASGMSVTTAVESNLLIANAVAGTEVKKDENYKSVVLQEVEAELQPVSTVDGTNYYYTYKAKANGDAEVEEYTALTGNNITINETNYKGFVDYVFDLKATNPGATEAIIKLSKLNLLYNGAVVENDKAARVAMFVQTGGDEDTDTVATMGTAADAIYTMENAANFDAGTAVNSTTTLAAVTYNGAVETMTVAAGADQYYKVTLRLWIEGEDTTCYSSNFKSLDEAWTLDVEFTLDSETDAVTNIGSEVTP